MGDMWTRALYLTGLQATHLLVAASALYQPTDTLPRMLFHVIISSTSFKVQVPGAQGLDPFPFPSVFPPLVISVSTEAGGVTRVPTNPDEDAWVHTRTCTYTNAHTLPILYIQLPALHAQYTHQVHCVQSKLLILPQTHRSPCG